MTDTACGCAEILRKTAMEVEHYTDVDVREVGAFGLIQNHPLFPPAVLRCPHGFTWAAQPTEWQIEDWRLRRVP